MRRDIDILKEMSWTLGKVKAEVDALETKACEEMFTPFHRNVVAIRADVQMLQKKIGSLLYSALQRERSDREPSECQTPVPLHDQTDPVPCESPLP